MNKKKLLTIFIPTYNRANCLKECIYSVIYSSKGYLDKVQIVVSDDGSTDNSRKIVETIIKKYSFIIYKKNKKNLYTDLHFSKLIQSTKTEYYWLLGDDDKITKNAIREIIKFIDLGYGLIYLNYSIWTKDFRNLLFKNGLGIDKDIKFVNHNKLIEKIGFNMGYISSVIAKKSFFTDISSKERKLYFGYTMPQFYPLYKSQINSCNALLVSKCYLNNRSGNNSEKHWFKIFIEGSDIFFNALFNIGYKKKSILIAQKKVIIDYLIPHILQLKIHSDVNLKLCFYLFRYVKKFIFLYLFIVFIILLPKSIIISRKDFFHQLQFKIKKTYGTI